MPARARGALIRHCAPDLVVVDASTKPFSDSLPHSVLRAEDLLAVDAGRRALPD